MSDCASPGYRWDRAFVEKRISTIMELFCSMANEKHNIKSIHTSLNDHLLGDGRAFLSRDVLLLFLSDTRPDGGSLAVSAADEIESPNSYW